MLNSISKFHSLAMVVKLDQLLEVLVLVQVEVRRLVTAASSSKCVSAFDLSHRENISIKNFSILRISRGCGLPVPAVRA